jgi:hypothetical protein
MYGQLADLKQHGSGALETYIRNVRLSLYTQAQAVILEDKQ